MDEKLLNERVRKAAHDVRTPLTSIAGFAELLRDDPDLPPDAREYARMIFDEAKRLSDVIENFFDEVTNKPE